MTNINFEETNKNINKISQSAYSAAKAFYALNTNTYGQLFDQQIAMAKLGMESITSQMELISTTKDYNAVVAGQTELANEISSKSQDIARNTMDIMNESKEEISTWVEGVAKEAAANIDMVKAA
ncbi:MAG TPA: phasin family protein [Thiotrichaceae bacterium]|jgi:phasin family protein|nr:phasin family protein [Thiotrichaceae bacterium]HIM08881.1 phasin family protein [Gammaproteobacteria bacterium]